MTHYCKVCNESIHPKRVAMGYDNTCPEHSTASKYVGFVVGGTETDHIVNIVKDPETVRDMERLMGARGLNS